MQDLAALLALESGMKIYLTRHGQSEWQVRRSTDLNTSLTATGHEQSRRLGQWLVTHPPLDETARLEISSLCASTFRRTQETAAYVANSLGLPVITEPSLGEAGFHVAEYLPSRESPLAPHPAYRPPEDYALFKAQARTALETLVGHAEAGGGPLLAVAHGGLLKTLLRLVVDSDNICFRLGNTGLHLVEWRRGRWHLVHLNLWEHLPTDLRTW